MSIIGSSYLAPISVLLEGLKSHYKGEASELMSGYKVNGYASSICILAVVCLESYVMRARYIHGATGYDLNRVPVTKYLERQYPDYSLSEATSEILIVRDLIAHNHLLKTSYSIVDDGLRKHSVERVSSGDKKFSAQVCKSTEKTVLLGLNTNPICIGYQDATAVLNMVWENLLFLEKKDRNQCYVSHLAVKHQGNYMKFSEIISTL